MEWLEVVHLGLLLPSQKYLLQKLILPLWLIGLIYPEAKTKITCKIIYIDINVYRF